MTPRDFLPLAYALINYAFQQRAIAIFGVAGCLTLISLPLVNLFLEKYSWARGGVQTGIWLAIYFVYITLQLAILRIRQSWPCRIACLTPDAIV